MRRVYPYPGFQVDKRLWIELGGHPVLFPVPRVSKFGHDLTGLQSVNRLAIYRRNLRITIRRAECFMLCRPARRRGRWQIIYRSISHWPPADSSELWRARAIMFGNVS